MPDLSARPARGLMERRTLERASVRGGMGTVYLARERKGRSILARAWRHAVPFAAGCASPLLAQLDHHAQTLQRFDLPNGLEIIVVENHAAPIATVLVAVRGGANAQSPGLEGLAHLFEHLVFRAYGREPGAFDLEVAKLGGIHQGTTTIESVNYYLVLPSDKTEHGIRLLARAITSARFDPDDLAAERMVVLDELERMQSDPEERFERRTSRTLWGAAWHRRDIGGDSLSLMRVTEVDLTEAYARQYVPNNSALIVTGDVDPDEVRQAARKHFGGWSRGPAGAAGARPDSMVPLAQSTALLLSSDVPDVTIRIGIQGPGPLDDPAPHAVDALVAILNDPASAFQRRLVGSGLFQVLTGSYVTLSEVGPVTFVGKTSGALAYSALLSLIAELDSLDLLRGITEDDLLVARRRWEVDAAVAREATATLAPSLAFWWAGPGTGYLLTSYDRMSALTLEDLRSAARRYIVRRPQVLGVLGPSGTMAQLTGLLQGSSGER